MSILQLVERGRCATEGALANFAIIDRLSPQYDRSALIAARTRLFELVDSVLRESSVGARLAERSEAVDLAAENFHKDSYLPHVEAAHQVFQGEEGVLNRVGPTANRAETFRNWAMHVRQFYLTILTDPELTSAMDKKKISVAELTVALSEFEHIVAIDRERGSDTSSERVAVQDAAQLAKEFGGWLAAFTDLAATRLAGSPDLLESLGISDGHAND